METGRPSYPIDVEDLGASWLSRATQATSSRSEPGPATEPVEDVFPTLDLDELAELDPTPSEEPDSEWLHAAEARERKERQS
jgi:hypothetical protein